MDLTMLSPKERERRLRVFQRAGEYAGRAFKRAHPGLGSDSPEAKAWEERSLLRFCARLVFFTGVY